MKEFMYQWLRTLMVVLVIVTLILIFVYGLSLIDRIPHFLIRILCEAGWFILWVVTLITVCGYKVPKK